MKNISKIIGIVYLMAVLLPSSISILKGQELENTTLNKEGVLQGEIANCFDVYKFQSIDISIGAGQKVYKPYDMVEIKGNIINKNQYPILDATLRAKILKNHPKPVEGRAKYITVDDIIIADNLTLKSNEKYEIKYNYFLPGNVPSGDYIIQYYVYNQDRFNLAGLSFTEDVIGNISGFKVEGKDQHFYLDKTNIIIDGQKYNTRGFMTKHSGNKNIPIKIPLVNPENSNKEVEISYKVYKWDDLLSNNLIEEKTQQLTINAKSFVDIQYDLDAKDEPIYYIVIVAKNIGETESSTIKYKTMAHIRLNLEDKNSPRINWVGLNKYPITQREDVQLMVCAHNTNYSTDKGPIKVLSTVKDSKGKTLSKISYSGEMVSAINGLANKFKLSKNSNSINIETSLYNSNNELVDNIKTTYSCKDINPDLCSYESNSLNIIIAIISIIGFIVCVGIFIKYNKIFKK